MHRPHSPSASETTTQPGDGITPEPATLSTSSPAYPAVEAAQVRAWEWRLATGEITWSLQANTIFGLAPGDSSGTFQGFLSLVHPSDRPQLQAAIQTAIETRQPYHLDHRIITPDGIIRWVSCRGRAVLDSDGHVAGMTGTTEDITRQKEAELALVDLQETLERRVRERTAGLEQAVRDLQEEIGRQRQTEAALKASEQRYHALYEHNPTMYFTLTPDGAILSVNRFGAEELGYRENELVGQSVLAVFQAADHHTVVGQLIACSQSPGQTFDWEIQKVRKGGQLLWVKERARAITGPDGRPIILIVCEDITEQRQAEAARTHSEERLRSFLNALDDLAFELDDRGTYLNVWTRNGATPLLPKPEIVGKSLVEIHGQETGTCYLAILRRVLASGTSESIEYTLSSNGQPRHFSAILSRIPAGAEIPATVACIVRETTTQKETELALRESEARLRAAQAIAQIGNWELDLQTNRLLWSDEIFRIFEVDQAQLSASYEVFLNTVHPDDRALVNDAYTKSVQNRSPYEIVHRLQMPDGRIKYVQERGETYYDGDGHPQRSVGTVQDITERRKAQLQLQHSQALLNSVFEHLPSMLFVKDARTLRFVEFNKAGERLTGFSREELLGKSDYDFFPREEADFFTGKDRAVLAGGSMLEIPEEEIQTKHRGVRILQTKKIPLCDAHGIPQYLLGISEDITDRKQAELALRVSEERFEIAFRSSPHPVVITELATGRCIEVNDTALQLFGFQRHEAVGHTTIAMELWPKPEDRTRFVTQLLANGTLRGVEFTFQTKDHRLRHCLVSSELIELNRTRCILTVGTDVTEKKEAEAALRESEERWQRFVADAPVGLVVVGADKHILSANKAFCALTGYSEQEVISHTYALYTHPDDLSKNLQLTDEFFAGQRQAYTYEKRYIRKSGEIIWVSVRASHITIHGHDTPLLLAVVEDITDRKQALADRERISQDLHDNLLQSLYAVGMQLEAGKLLVGKAPRKSKQHVTQAIRQLNHLVLEVRQFITDLTRRTAPTLDFSVALNQLVASCSSETRTAPELDLDPTALTVVTPTIGEQLLSIAREALSNSVRHASATHRSVSLTKTDGSIRLRVTDNGKGFDPGRKRRRGHGLANMAARARTIGAQFTLDSAPDRGTSITIDIPTGDPHAC